MRETAKGSPEHTGRKSMLGLEPGTIIVPQSHNEKVQVQRKKGRKGRRSWTVKREASMQKGRSIRFSQK